jgi:hypothetical protein
MTFKPRTQEYLRAPTNFYEEGINLYGRKNSFLASLGDSGKTMMDSLTFTNSIANWYAGKLDKEAGEQPVTKEYFDKYNDKYNTGLNYDPKELPSQFSLRLSNRLRSNIRRKRVNERYGATNFIGSMLPELVNPLNVVPFGRLATLGKFANKTALAVNQGNKFKAAFGAYGNYFKEALIGNAAVEPLYYLNAKQYGEDYTLQDSLMNIGLGTAIGTGFFGTVAAGMKYRSANRLTQQLQTYEEMYSYMESGQYDKAINVALDSDPKFEAQIKRNKELISLFEDDTLNLEKATPQQLELLSVAVKTHYEGLFETALTNTLSSEISEALDSNTPISSIALQYKSKFARILKAHETGDLSNLTEADLETYRQIADLPEMDAVFDRTIEEEEFAEYERQRMEDEARALEDEDAARSGAQEEKPAKNKIPPKKKGADFGATQQAVAFANKIREIKSKANASTIREAVEKGVISKEDGDVLLKSFYDHYAKAFADEIRIANRALNEIFGYGFKIKTMDYKGESRAVGENYASIPEEILIQRAEDFLATYDSPSATLFHEGMHAMKVFDRENWNKIYDSIKAHPKLFKKLEQIIKERGYKFTDVPDEIPSVFMEWAITQKEFWQELSGRDKTFFEKFRDWINKMFTSIIRFQNRPEIAKLMNKKEMQKLLTSGDPEELARGFARILNESRKLRKFDSDSKLGRDIINTSVNRGTKFEEPNYQETLYTNEEYTQPFKDYDSVGKNDFISQNFNTYFEQVGFLFESGKPEFDLVFNKLITLAGEFDEKQLTEATDDFLSMFSEEGKKAFAPLFDDFYKMSKSYNYVVNADRLDDFVNKPLEKFEARFVDLAREIKSKIQANKTMDPQAVAAIAVYRSYQKRVFNLFKDVAIRQRNLSKLKGKTGAMKLATLRSMLDGQLRRGVELESSLHIDLEVAAEADAEILMQVLHDYGLFDLFFGADDTEWIKAYRGSAQEREALKVFGSNLKTASQEFHKQLMYALRNNVLPEDWNGVKGLEVLFETIQNLESYQLNKLNSVGAFINKLDSFAGVSQRWDRTIVSSMSKADFIKDMKTRLDVKETIKKHGGVYKAGNELKTLDEKTFDKWLGTWYDQIIKGEVEDAPDARIDARRSRLVVIKPDMEMDTILKYSGYDSVGKLMVEQIGQRARSVVLANYGGSNPKKMFTDLAKGMRNDINKKSYKATIEYMVGDLDDPVDAPLAEFFQKIGDFSDIVFLGGSGVSTITDVATAAMTLRYQGVTLGEAAGLMVDAYKDAVSRRFSGDRTGMGNFLRAQGAGWDVIQNSVVRRITADPTKGRGALARGKNMFFKLNGLNALTNAHQEMYLDVLTRGIAEELKIWNDGGDMDDLLVDSLRRSGITDKDFEVLYRNIETTPDGVDRIGVTSIDDQKVALKLRTYFKKYLREAVFMPDPGTYAQATFGFRRGTFIGEMARVATRYQPFMLGMSKLTYRRFANGYYGKNNRNMMMMSHLIGYVGTSLAMAYVATIIKDLLKGNEPINLTNMTSRDLSRLAQQGGFLGLGEIILDSIDYGPLEATSPLVSTTSDLLLDITSGDKEGAMRNVSSLTGGNIPGPGAWLHSLIGTVFGETTNDLLLGEVEEMEDLRLD